MYDTDDVPEAKGGTTNEHTPGARDRPGGTRSVSRPSGRIPPVRNVPTVSSVPPVHGVPTISSTPLVRRPPAALSTFRVDSTGGAVRTAGGDRR